MITAESLLQFACGGFGFCVAVLVSRLFKTIDNHMLDNERHCTIEKLISHKEKHNE